MTSAAATIESYRRLGAKRAAALTAALGILVVAAIIDIATGPALLPVPAVARAVTGLPVDPATEAIVWTIRMPVALMAIVVGAALGLTGALMQTILNNPLASSYTLGISAGAGFGAALVIVAGSFIPVPETFAVPACAFLFALLSCTGVFLIGRVRRAGAETLVLAGIALLFLFQALLSLLQFLASPEALQQIVFWLFGSLLKATWGKVAIVAAVLVAVVPLLLRDVWRLTALKLGDDRARGLGVDVASLRVRTFVVISVLTGAAVAFVGTIGFVGLVAPHIARMILGEDQRFLLPGSAACGAILLSLASIASKTLSPGAIFPIGIVTSLIGVPFFVWLVIRSKRRFW